MIRSDTIKALKIISASESNNEIDLSDIQFVRPFLITPITAFIGSSKKEYNCLRPKDFNVNSYLNTIKFPESVDVNVLKQKQYQTYFPLYQFSNKNKDYDKRIYEICDKIITTNGLPCNKNVIYLFLSELLDNIREHSESEFNFIHFQKQGQKLNLSIVDMGITIPKSYENCKMRLKNDISALKYALEGKSTKKELLRGTGIRTTVNLICEALHGQLFIISRNAGFYKCNTGEIKFIDLKKHNISFQGTIINISFNIPTEKIDYTKYIST